MNLQNPIDVSSNHFSTGKKILQLIGSRKGVQNGKRELILWFSSKEEGSIYRLASILKKSEYKISIHRLPDSDKWLCVAEKVFVPADEPLDMLCMNMLELAEKFDVLFNNWETIPHGGSLDTSC